MTVRGVAGRAVAGFLRHCTRAVKRRLGFRLEGLDLSEHESPHPDPEAGMGFDVGNPTQHSGRIEHGLGLRPDEKLDVLGAVPYDQNERFLRGTRHLEVLNHYGRRRRAGLDVLNAASLVTPPSRFMVEAYAAMGVERERLRQVRLGQPHFDQINRRARRSPFYGQRPWDARSATRPVRFAFLGTTRNNKGLDVLVRAIPLLEDGVRKRCHFIIRAQGQDWLFRKVLSPYPEVSFLGGYDLLQLIASADEYDVGVLPHIWLENSPLVLLEHLHAGKFVVASRLGGPPEWIVEPAGDRPGNGLLFAGGHPDHLARCITRIVRGEVTLPSPKEVHEISILRSYPDHVREVEGIYEELLGRRAERASGAVASVERPEPVTVPR
jgi:glycosyltransferase involved in cell wall biosynthesis